MQGNCMHAELLACRNSYYIDVWPADVLCELLFVMTCMRAACGLCSTTFSMTLLTMALAAAQGIVAAARPTKGAVTTVLLLKCAGHGPTERARATLPPQNGLPFVTPRLRLKVLISSVNIRERVYKRQVGAYRAVKCNPVLDGTCTSVPT